MDETAVKDYIIVCRELFERTTVDGIRIMPWTISLISYGITRFSVDGKMKHTR